MISAPHPLVTSLVATAAVVTAALVWSGWRLVDQQADLDARLARDQAEAAADVVAARLRERLADTGERLGARLPTPEMPPPVSLSDEVPIVVVVVGRADVTVDPPGALPFLPHVPLPPVASAAFDPGEEAEFGPAGLSVAADRYRVLTTASDPLIRAGALVRLARVLRKAGQPAAALTASDELQAMGDVRTDTDGVPASLAGLNSARLAHQLIGDAANERRTAEDIRQGLDEGRWAISRGMAEFYRDEVSEAPRPEAWRLAGAIADLLPDRLDAFATRGQRIASADGRPVILVWRANAERVALAATFVDQYVEDGRDTVWQLRDPDDRLLASAGDPGTSPPVERVIAGGGSAWTLRVFAKAAASSMAGGRRRTLAGGLAAVLVALWGATYLMVRAIRREAEVSRLQTDFVAAVSHEFRTPLTTMRQMTEMLDAGRVVEESRRRQYFRVLVSETARLQRLVETLLNAGRLESGQAPYTFAEVDPATVIDTAVADVRAQVGATGGTIEVDVARLPGGVAVQGDFDALRLALRNLIDNAVKYSREGTAVRVTCHADEHAVAIDVADEGPGIEPDEQTRIFRKFVRGRAAVAGRVAGTGIGLAMVQRIASAHGGEVRLRSEPGVGSVFTLVLPRSAGVSSHASVAAPVNEPAVRTHGSVGS